MIEKIGPIKNPLTIIAIFAAIAEISGTVVLPFITSTNQAIYVWFLMIFPIMLIVLFFITLNFNHKVLYAPSDYQNEDNFLKSLPRATLAEKVLKIEAEIAEEESVAKNLPAAQSVPGKIESTSASVTEDQKISYQMLVHRSTQASYMLAEELIFRKLSKEFSTEIQREVKLDSGSAQYIFDGIVRERGVTTFIEIKFWRKALSASWLFRDVLTRIQKSASLLPEQAANFRVLLAVATYEGSTSQKRIADDIELMKRDFPFPIEARLYNLTELEQEFNIGA
jgi:hypothetical protein